MPKTTRVAYRANIFLGAVVGVISFAIGVYVPVSGQSGYYSGIAALTLAWLVGPIVGLFILRRGRRIRQAMQAAGTW